MIDCSTYRRAILADPHDSSPELAEHVASCAVCSGYAQRVLLFEERLERELRLVPPTFRAAAGAVDGSGVAGPATVASASGASGASGAIGASGASGVAGTVGRAGAGDSTGAAMSARAEQGRRAVGAAPSAVPEREVPLRRRRDLRVRGGWLAAAASVLIVLTMMTSLWLAVPHASLAADVVAHMAGEPKAWVRTDAPVPAGKLDQILREAHASIAPGAPMVSYAQSCWFRGHYVPHLVVQTDHGPVTVMVLVHEAVKKPVRFDEGGYRGVLMPDDGHGSLAVLARDRDAADPEWLHAMAMRVREALIWQG